ncbi:MAG: hypothetical protein LBC68_04830 [Prevotellaceae bacterium]|jgi:hypothetical protein|nr:hypothetical protein [Prevotellaceae bacterium]
MKGSRLDNLLIQLELKNSGTIFFKNEENSFDINLLSDMQTKLRLIQPDAIYIFNNHPFILFFDLTEEKDLEKESNIHKKAWSFDNSPIVIIIKDNDIQIYNALNYIKENNRLEKINLSGDERNQKFSFWNLQSGVTWQWFQDEYLNNNRRKETKKRVNEKLFQNIKDVRNVLIDREKDPEGSIPNSLILRLIFIRYLIDRGVKIDKRYISGRDLSSQRHCFCNLIRDSQRLNELFTLLNDKFNGVLFKDVDIALEDMQATALSQIFKGEMPEEGTLFYGGDFYFDIFDFSIIPVEVISGIYESLIGPETRDLQAAVYTPAFLAEYILNDTVDDFLKKQNISECKIFEVAVGSGIFLVQSLRKMIEKEIELNGNDDKKAFSEKIREIAKRNLFGVDINEEALKVTCFSIYIALLDYQAPKDIDVYRFPNLLYENLFHADFFNTEHEYNSVIKKINPHYILGNPPWKKDESEKHLGWANKENVYNKKIKGEIEIAQSFLMRVKDFMSSDTKVALIVTSTIFYNVSSTTKTFKNKFLTTYCLDKFFDLSPVRRLIFEEKNSPASIVYFRLSKEDEYSKNIISHQSVKINYFLKYFKMLVIEKYDRKEISQSLFIENDWMFKVALYGNILDFVLLKKIISAKIYTNDFLKQNNAIKGVGIKKREPKSKIAPKHYPQLINFPFIENSDVKLFYTPTPSKILDETNITFSSGRKVELFQHSKILLKEQCSNESILSVSYQIGKGVFVNGVSGISFENESLTKLLYAYFLADWLTYYLFLTSCAWGVATRPAVRFKDEYLSFPFIESDEKTKTELINLVNLFLKPFEDYYKQKIRSESSPVNQEILSKISSTIDNLYGIKGYEKDLIDYVLNVSRYQFQESKQQLFTKRVDLDKAFLEKYTDVYLREFGKIYDDEFMQVEIYLLNHFIAMNFKFLDEEPEKQIVYSDSKEETKVFEIFVDKLSISQETNTANPAENLFIQKDIKGFETNSFYIIKPNEYKCWHRAMAWYDVAEFTERIEKAELKQFNRMEE